MVRRFPLRQNSAGVPILPIESVVMMVLPLTVYVFESPAFALDSATAHSQTPEPLSVHAYWVLPTRSLLSCVWKEAQSGYGGGCCTPPSPSVFAHESGTVR